MSISLGRSPEIRGALQHSARNKFTLLNTHRHDADAHTFGHVAFEKYVQLIEMCSRDEARIKCGDGWCSFGIAKWLIRVGSIVGYPGIGGIGRRGRGRLVRVPERHS